VTPHTASDALAQYEALGSVYCAFKSAVTKIVLHCAVYCLYGVHSYSLTLLTSSPCRPRSEGRGQTAGLNSASSPATDSNPCNSKVKHTPSTHHTNWCKPLRDVTSYRRVASIRQALFTG
jgi:hypothetical protein